MVDRRPVTNVLDAELAWIALRELIALRQSEATGERVETSGESTDTNNDHGVPAACENAGPATETPGAGPKDRDSLTSFHTDNVAHKKNIITIIIKAILAQVILAQVSMLRVLL